MRIRSRFIGKIEHTEKLYQLEEKIGQAIRNAAEELVEVGKKIDAPIDYWKEAVPEELAHMCELYGYELHKAEKEAD